MFTPNWQAAETKINLLGKNHEKHLNHESVFFERKVVISTPKLENLVNNFTPEKFCTIAQKNVMLLSFTFAHQITE